MVFFFFFTGIEFIFTGGILYHWPTRQNGMSGPHGVDRSMATVSNAILAIIYDLKESVYLE